MFTMLAFIIVILLSYLVTKREYNVNLSIIFELHSTYLINLFLMGQGRECNSGSLHREGGEQRDCTLTFCQRKKIS